MREKPSFIPQEYIRERPPVFSDKETAATVRRFAGKYIELRKLPEMEPGAASLGDIVLRVERIIGERTKSELLGLLKDSNYTEEQAEKIAEGVSKRDFAEIEQLGQDKMTAALGLAVVAERARTSVVIDTLKALPAHSLDRFGMNPTQRDIVTDLIKSSQSADPEYVRFKTRAMRDENYEHRPVDSVRESNRMYRGLRNVCEALERQGAQTVFGKAGDDFLKYLRKIEARYKPLTAEKKIKTIEWRNRLEKEASGAFDEFTKKYPDFPLLVLSGTNSYVETEANNLGWDPEMRILWQSPEQRDESEELRRGCRRFTSFIREKLPGHAKPETMEYISGMNPIVCDDIGSFGVNMTFRAEAQNFDLANAFMLVRNREASELVAPAKEKLRKTFGHEWDDILESREFFKLLEIQMMNHELGHSVYGEESKEVKGLGKTYDLLDEYKADLLAGSALNDVAGDWARQVFGERATEAINLAILANVLSNSGQAPGGEFEYYRKSAINIMRRLEESGIFEDRPEGVFLNAVKLNENWSSDIFTDQARKVLEIYKLAGSSLRNEQKNSRVSAKEIIDTEPSALVNKIIIQKGN